MPQTELQLLARCLNDKDFSPADWNQLFEAATRHGVLPLLFYNLEAQPADSKVFERFRNAAAAWEAAQIFRQEEICNLIDDANDIDLLLFKGFSLAYQIYSTPGIRPAMDVDVLVRKEDIRKFVPILERSGYKVEPIDLDSRISFQTIAYKDLRDGQTLSLDVHYEINNQQKYITNLAFQDLWDRSVLVPELSPKARTLSMSDALIIACIHRLGHLCDKEPTRLIWLYDIHLLLTNMQEPDIQNCIYAIESKELHVEVGSGIFAASQVLGTEIPDPLCELLAHSQERIPKLERQLANQFYLLWNQFRHQSDWRDRVSFLRQTALPSPEYMRGKYPESSAWLPLLYCHRFGSGIYKRIKSYSG